MIQGSRFRVYLYIGCRGFTRDVCGYVGTVSGWGVGIVQIWGLGINGWGLRFQGHRAMGLGTRGIGIRL